MHLVVFFITRKFIIEKELKMRRIKTLKKNYEFNNVLKQGKYYIKKHVIIYIKENGKSDNVIGIAINTHLCNAAGRNRIKRLIREGFYSVKDELKKGYDIVFLWNKKSKIKYDCFFDIKQEIRDCFEEAQLLEKK